MMLFWILTAAMILVALAIVAPALLKKDALAELDRDKQNVVIAKEGLEELQAEYDAGNLTEAEFEQAKLELEQALILDLGSKSESDQQESQASKSGKWALLGSAVVVSLLTVGIYLKLGEPVLIDPAHQEETMAGQKLPSVEEMVAALTARLQQVPDDSQGWYLLGRTYMVMDDFPNAVKAFERFYQLEPDQPSAMLALADATSIVNGGSLAGRPAELIRKAVVLAPEDPTALWLAGMVEDQAGNLQLAIDYWMKLAPMVEEDSESARRVAALIENAQSRLGSSSTASNTAAPVVAPAQDGITLQVSVAEELQQKVNPNAVLFIYARPANGSKMPLAAVRLKASDLPTKVVLDDATSMTPVMKLSSQKEVLVGALLSSSGNAAASPGDLRGELSGIPVGAGEPVSLKIDTLVE